MKFNILSLSLSLGLIFVLFTSSRRDPNNPPTGKTGAPGETTCSQSTCHSGGSYAGTVTISGVPDTVIFGHVYPITLKNTSNAFRSGFQLTCLDNSNVKCGTLSSASGVSVASGSGRQYARQSSPKNLSGGSASWTFNWTAPATASGNKATFYYVSLCANGNGQNSGDNVLVSTKPITFTTPTSATVEPIASLVKVYPTEVVDELHVDIEESKEGRLYIFSADGRLMRDQSISNANVLNISDLKAGAYLAKIQIGEASTVRKFVKY